MNNLKFGPLKVGRSGTIF